MKPFSRRELAQLASGLLAPAAFAQIPGQRPPKPEGVTVLNPCHRVPVSLLIDDSTCLVNLAHFGIPHFAEAFPARYKQNWRALPREIPDTFVRNFGEWCKSKSVKGKYSIVPYPACVGWVDRDMPGWSKRDLDFSLDLVRTLMVPDWDIHPEMVTHTWVVDTKTGRPLPDRTEKSMENFGWSVGKSADELADYLAYALRILKNAELPCEGITTPGGFGGKVLPELAQAVKQSVRDVYKAEIPHYFRHAFMDDRSVAPRVEYVTGLDTNDPQCVVSIIGCIGDLFGGWDGLETPQPDRFITPDLKSGRMKQVIDKGEPAIMLCHWPGIYCNGKEDGFNAFKEIVSRLHAAYDNIEWMKISDIARYWAAKELTKIDRATNQIAFKAPYACQEFTIKTAGASPRLRTGRDPKPLKEVTNVLKLDSGTWYKDGREIIVCFDLPKGDSTLLLA